MAQITDENLIVMLVAAIKQYGKDMNLIIDDFKSVNELLDKDPFVKIGWNPMPDGKGLILTALVGEKKIKEWQAMEKMLTTHKVGRA
jgi:hypothetical protein